FGVNALDFFEEMEGRAELAGDGDEGFDVLWEAGAAVAESSVEKVAADAFVGADAVGDHLNVSAGGFADSADRVDVADLEGEEAVGSVLDELGGIDVGNEDRGLEGLVDA